MVEDTTVDRYLWCFEYLEEHAKYPIKGQLKMGHLRKRFAYWKSLEDRFNFSGTTCATLDILRDYNMYDWTLNHRDGLSDKQEEYYSRFNTYDLEALSKLNNIDDDPNHWVGIRKIFEDNSAIKAEGSHRGRTYRYKTSRPMFMSVDVASVIEQFLRKTGAEMKWSELYETVTEAIIKFHKSIEKHPQPKHSGGAIVVMVMHDNERVTLELPYGRATQYVSQFEFGSDIDEWAKVVYTRRWFESSSSNVQRYFGIQGYGVVKGSLRGAWMHKYHLHKIRPEEGSADLYKRLGEITQIIEDTRMMYQDSLEDIVALAQALQRQHRVLESQISDKTESADADLERVPEKAA